MTEFVKLLLAIIQILPIVPSIVECFTDDDDLMEEHREDINQVILLTNALGATLQNLQTASAQRPSPGCEAQNPPDPNTNVPKAR
jgi:hypothetical protein